MKNQLKHNVRHFVSALKKYTKKLGVRAVELHDTRLTHHLCNDTKGVIFPDMLHCHKVAGVVRHKTSSLGRHGTNRETLTGFEATV